MHSFIAIVITILICEATRLNFSVIKEQITTKTYKHDITSKI